jgi:hypothetical protein
VADFAGRDYSTLIESINEFYAEPPYNEETIGSFAKIRIAADTPDEVQLCFSLVPPSIDAHPEAEMIWENTIDGALAFVFGIPSGQSRAFTEAAQRIREFRTYQDLPLVVAAYDASYLSDDAIRQQLNDPQSCRITHYAPEQMAIDSIARDVVIAIINNFGGDLLA